jgi:hypothetical protein
MTPDGPLKPTKSERRRDQYRRILAQQDLSNQEVDEMRKHVIRLAQTICAKVWGKRVD